MKLRTFEDLITTDLKDDLSDPEFAVGYLQASLEEAQAEGDLGVFLVALRDVAMAQESMANVAKSAGVSRASFYKTLSSKGNPEFNTIVRVLSPLGMKLQVVFDR